MAAGPPPKEQPIVIRRIKKGGGEGHHGGAWKVAYADFVTAMMAFFLLLWLLNVTTAVQRKGIADYFAPASISKSESGAGGVFGGRSISAPEAKLNDTSAPGVETMEPQPASAEDDEAEGEGKDAGGTSSKNTNVAQGTNSGATSGQNGLNAGGLVTHPLTPQQQQAARNAEVEQERFESAQAAIKEAISQSPDLKGMANQIMVDVTDEGLRVQLIDRDNRPMFALGGSDMYPATRALLQAVAKVIQPLPNKIAISGHTDGHQFPPGSKHNNWDLSADRANACRRLLTEDGIADDRIASVAGRADREPFDAKDLLDPRNRRISIVLLRDSLAKKRAAADAKAGQNSHPLDEDDSTKVQPAQPAPVDNYGLTPAGNRPPSSILE